MRIFRSFAFYLALIGVILAVFLIKKLTVPQPAPQHEEPAINPFDLTIAASGIIEAIDKNIEIGVPESALVKDVYVKVDERVEPGQLLFRLDDRQLLGNLLVHQAQVKVAMATLRRLEDQLERLERIEDPRAISQEELNTRRSDKAVAKAQLESAEAQVTQTILMLDRLSICAPKSGTILQQNIRKGEYVQSGGVIPMILGSVERLQVRAEVDEQNASCVTCEAAAYAFPKNNSSLKIPLRFERIEPFIIPKRSLTGAGNEKVDTRVLQVIYSFDPNQNFPLYVGQQVDIFIETFIEQSKKENALHGH